MEPAKCKVLGLIMVLLIFSSCGVLERMYDPDGLSPDDDEDENSSYVTSDPSIEPSHKFAIALGGVAPGRDELILVDENKNIRDLTGRKVEFFTNSDVVGLLPRPGFDSFASGSGAQIIPQRPGIATITYSIDGAIQDEVFEVTVPPQSLIQILMGEARGELASEAELNDDGAVALSSTSPTGDAIAAVIRNRVLLLESGYDLSTFEVDEDDWNRDPPTSHWDAVIKANDGIVYQFSPVDPTDLNNSIYKNSEARSFLDSSYFKAYDQAVLTSAAIFNNTAPDKTGGAFAFFSPTPEEMALLKQALSVGSATLPAGCGTSDENFPLFAPVQVLIHPDVAVKTENGVEVPSFIFVRSRGLSMPAVTDVP